MRARASFHTRLETWGGLGARMAGAAPRMPKDEDEDEAAAAEVRSEGGRGS